MQLVNVGTVNIQATIDGKATPENVASGSNASSTTDGSLASFFDVITDGGDAAQKGKKDWENTQKTMKDIVDFGNKVLTKELAKEWLKKDNPNWDDESLKSLNKAALKQLLAAPDSIKKMFGVRQPKNTQVGKVLEATKGIASNLPYVGMAIGIIDYLVDGGEEKKGDEKSGPVTYDINLKLSGTLTEKQRIHNVTFFTPGSPIPSSTGNHLTPIYNNILGVFNVLELPELEYAELTPTITVGNRIFSGSSCQDGYDEFNNFEGAGDVKLRQYRPKTNIKYVVNPASEMEVHSIDAAIILEYGKEQPLFVTRPDQISGNVAMPYHNMMAFSNTQLDDWCNIWTPPIPDCDTSLTGLERRVDDIINSTGLKLDYVSADYPTDDSTFIRFRTGYVPITCFTSSDFMLLGTNNYGKIYVKLYIKLKHKTNINAEPVTMIVTYDWTEKVKAATKNSTISGTYNTKIFANSIDWKSKWFKCGVGNFDYGVYSDYKYGSNWFLGNVPFGNKGMYLRDKYSYSNEQFITVEDRLIIPTGASIPDNSVIKAGGLITIEPNVTFGNNVLIVSGIKIDLQAPNSINPTLELRIEPLNEILFNCTDFDYASLHNTPTEINQFCNKTEYKDIVYSTAPRIDDEDEEHDNNKVPSNFDFKLIPNPNNGHFGLEFNKSLTDFDIEILDVSGKIVFSAKQIDPVSKYNIDISHLDDGVYFVRVTDTTNSTHLQKLIKHQ
ncbi:MAG: T9SS type A sorting domain-containing protein [Bacteroidota bacterium]|nr:T9SS type A sorting domain-containing protein [Bacteroidota bacterium]